MKLPVILLAMASLANAGVLKTAVKLNIETAAKVASYPVRHPLKTLKALKTALL